MSATTQHEEGPQGPVSAPSNQPTVPGIIPAQRGSQPSAPPEVKRWKFTALIVSAVGLLLLGALLALLIMGGNNHLTSDATAPTNVPAPVPTAQAQPPQSPVASQPASLPQCIGSGLTPSSGPEVAHAVNGAVALGSKVPDTKRFCSEANTDSSNAILTLLNAGIGIVYESSTTPGQVPVMAQALLAPAAYNDGTYDKLFGAVGRPGAVAPGFTEFSLDPAKDNSLRTIRELSANFSADGGYTLTPVTVTLEWLSAEDSTSPHGFESGSGWWRIANIATN